MMAFALLLQEPERGGASGGMHDDRCLKRGRTG